MSQSIRAQNTPGENPGQTANADRKVRICTGGVLNSKAINFPQPEYPKEAQDKNISGPVAVRVSIDEEGNVTSAEACSGPPLLGTEAEKAAIKAKFKPTKLSGRPVKVSGVLVYDFTLKEKKIIRGGIVNGKATYLPPPVYPPEARDLCLGGEVEVEIEIDFFIEKDDAGIEDFVGKVISARAVSGDELLRSPAEEAARKARFRRADDTNEQDFIISGKLVYNFDSFVKCIDGGVVNDKAISLPKPEIGHIMHPGHLQIKQEEEVRVRVVIDVVEGNVIWAKAISGHPLLRAPSEHAARQAKFRGVICISQPLKVTGVLVYKFKPGGIIETDPS
ncbi:MAG: energy transducer TonB [Pyrinomonadaceae bacterium]